VDDRKLHSSGLDHHHDHHYNDYLHHNSGSRGKALEVLGNRMKTRAELNDGISSLGQTADIVDLSLLDLYHNVHLDSGSLFVVGVVHGNKGSSAQIPVMLLKGRGSISALQFDLLLPSGFTYQSVSAGPASTAAGKSVSANLLPTGLRVLIFGLNQNVIGTGVLATAQVRLESSLTLPNYSIPISGIVSSDPSGLAVTTSGVTGTVLIP
jgi:hypothetical protein